MVDATTPPNDSTGGRIIHDASTGGGSQMWGTGPTPAMIGKPLPPDDPWVVGMVNMFHIPLPEAQLFAGRFRDNMFQWLNNQIKHDMQKQHEAAQKFKESIDQ